MGGLDAFGISSLGCEIPPPLCKRIAPALALTLGLCAQQDTSAHQDQASGAKLLGHTAAVSRRGDQAMGFSHEKTTHHFRLFPDGGAIEVTANDRGDVESRAQILQPGRNPQNKSHPRCPPFCHASRPLFPAVAILAHQITLDTVPRECDLLRRTHLFKVR